ncbi:restriction endonuclease subunit S [Rhizobium leguminosarum]|uniref:restriction endonuclease subunit S n=1 Tax=Rhizobium leguminosarum TaxID=384 RepID=UPI0010316A27|nr:restriction endonuclease subunit S [Rhizobium leguminosarum]TAX95672.1 restriction endonuclease subunit S [Rhizobium leguminosarum]
MTSIDTLLTDHLDLWTSAIARKSSAGRGRSMKFSLYGIDKLRSLLLDLAVRGKLVRQDPEDEPASELLKRIDAERQRQISGGKLKRGKPLKAPDEIPFPIPHTWVWSQLGAVTNYGETEKLNPGEVEPHTWVLELEDVEKATSRLIEKVRYTERQFQSQKNRFYPGDVIYGKLRPYLDKVLIADEAGVCTTEMVPIRAYAGLEATYLRLFLKAPFFISLASASTHGMNLPRLGTDRAREAAIAIPPLAEQLRIVAKVDELMALCDRLEAGTYEALEAHQLLVTELLATLTASRDAQELAENWVRFETHFDTLFVTEDSVDQLKQTILQLAVTGKLVPQDPEDEPASELLMRCNARRAYLVGRREIKKAEPLPAIDSSEHPFSLPKGWVWARFEQAVAPEFAISYGVLVPGEDQEGGVPFVRIADLSIDDPAETPEKSISPSIDAQYERTRLQGGEILMGVVGSIGKLGIAPESWRGANIARAICRIMPNGEFSNRYLIWVLQSEFMQNGFRGDTRTLAQPTLNINLIRSALTPVPPRAEQERIVAKIEELWRLCSELNSALSDATSTKRELADALVSKAVG